MFLVKELRLFYLDLQDPDYKSAIGMVHSRFLHQHGSQLEPSPQPFYPA